MVKKLPFPTENPKIKSGHEIESGPESDNKTSNLVEREKCCQVEVEQNIREWLSTLRKFWQQALYGKNREQQPKHQVKEGEQRTQVIPLVAEWLITLGYEKSTEDNTNNTKTSSPKDDGVVVVSPNSMLAQKAHETVGPLGFRPIIAAGAGENGPVAQVVYGDQRYQIERFMRLLNAAKIIEERRTWYIIKWEGGKLHITALRIGQDGQVTIREEEEEESSEAVRTMQQGVVFFEIGEELATRPTEALKEVASMAQELNITLRPVPYRGSQALSEIAQQDPSLDSEVLEFLVSPEGKNPNPQVLSAKSTFRQWVQETLEEAKSKHTEHAKYFVRPDEYLATLELTSGRELLPKEVFIEHTQQKIQELHKKASNKDSFRVIVQPSFTDGGIGLSMVRVIAEDNTYRVQIDPQNGTNKQKLADFADKLYEEYKSYFGRVPPDTLNIQIGLELNKSGDCSTFGIVNHQKIVAPDTPTVPGNLLIQRPLHVTPVVEGGSYRGYLAGGYQQRELIKLLLNQHVSEKEAREIADAITWFSRKYAEYLQSLGYAGPFGIDFFFVETTDGKIKVVATEANVRFTGTTHTERFLAIRSTPSEGPTSKNPLHDALEKSIRGEYIIVDCDHVHSPHSTEELIRSIRSLREQFPEVVVIPKSPRTGGELSLALVGPPAKIKNALEYLAQRGISFPQGFMEVSNPTQILERPANLPQK